MTVISLTVGRYSAAASCSPTTAPVIVTAARHCFVAKTNWHARGCSLVCCGERRSANRTTWTTGQRGTGAAKSVCDSEETPTDAEQSPADIDVFAVAADLAPQFMELDRLIAWNSSRVQAAMKKARVGPHHWAGSTGYGHGDLGREALDQVMASVMGAEAAMVRRYFMSGTHAIAAGLYAVLRPGDEMLSVAGRPYDTMEEVIGLRGEEAVGSLRDWGVQYREMDLTEDGRVDFDQLASSIIPGVTTVAYVQRSCGYALRPTLSIQDIKRVVQTVKNVAPECLVLVDNCYGEFTEEQEPCQVGADMVMGSLIKNPGGTIVTGGGYVAGREDLMNKVSARLSAPGVGRDSGGVSGVDQRLMFQGLFLGPQMVGEALKGGRLVAEVMARRGHTVVPPPGKCKPNSFITAVEMGSPQGMKTFCRALQSCAPVGSYILPEPGVTAGYGDEVIFADGTFVDGATSELSADGPLRPPYVVYCQGGTHWTHWVLVLERVLEALDHHGK